VQAACLEQTLNALIECGAAAHAALRRRLMELLDANAEAPLRNGLGAALIPRAGALLLKPVAVPNYTDFYASIDHAANVGRLFRPENPLLPNYKYLPIAYHGRASSLVASGTAIRRPSGQMRSTAAVPVFAASRFLDYEVEVAAYICDGNTLGDPIAIAGAASRIFGLSLLNDWSARDLQSWEYQPLGPFLGKSFATSVSPWVVPMAALAPFRVAALARPSEDPAPLAYLHDDEDQAAGALDLILEASLLTSGMRQAGVQPFRLSRSNMRDLYWTPAQMIAHHTSNGCNLVAGDLLATGTISGRGGEAAGCLLERTRNGKEPLSLPDGETRTGLEDGDELILSGYCRRQGLPLISLGECRGLVLPAR
jgi:fumarylacetoacetase